MGITDYNVVDTDNALVPGSPPIELGEGIGGGPTGHQTLRSSIQRIMADLKSHDVDWQAHDAAWQAHLLVAAVIDNIYYRVADRTALKAIDTTAITAVYLDEDGRQGPFVWTAGDYSAEIAADVAEGIYVKANAVLATAGAWVRIYVGPIRFKWFGPVGDWSHLTNTGTDNATAWQSFMAIAEILGEPQQIHAGLFRITAPGPAVTNFVNIEGAGKMNTQLVFDDCNGINIDHSSLKYSSFRIANLSFVTTTEKTRVAITFTGWATGGNNQPREIDNVTFIGTDRMQLAGGPYLRAWLTCIDATEGDRIQCSWCYFQGADQDGNNSADPDFFPVANSGIKATNSTHFTADHCHFYLIETAVVVRGQSETFHLTNAAIVACNKGFDSSAPTGPANNHKITNSHASCMTYCLNFGQGDAQVTLMHVVDNCLLMRRADSQGNTIDDFEYIRDQSKYLSVKATTFFAGLGVDAVAHNLIGIRCYSGSECGTFFGNTFDAQNICVQFDSGADNHQFMHNVTYDDAASLVRAPIVDNGTGNKHSNNGGHRAHLFKDDEAEGTWTPVLNFSGGNTGLTYTASGSWSRNRDMLTATVDIVLTAIGSATGNPDVSLPTITGFTIGQNSLHGIVTHCANMANLTSRPTGRVIAGPTMALQDSGAAGSTVLDETNFTATTTLRMIITGRLT